MSDQFDAVVVGAGPNGLTAALSLQRAGLSVLLIEANEEIGGAARTRSLMRSDVVHDMGSAVHPMAVASPVFRELGITDAVDWLYPEIPLAHPLSDNGAVAQHYSLKKTADQLGEDGNAYRRLFSYLSSHWEKLVDEILQPPIHIPAHPLVLARFGLPALLPASTLATTCFRKLEAKALFTGLAAHSNYSLKSPLTSAIGLVLGALTHAVGWPIPQGGAQAISDALADQFEAGGGRIQTGWDIKTLEELPSSAIVLLNLTPRQVSHVAGPDLPKKYVAQLQSYRYGPAAYKIDYILDDPIPWSNTLCRRAGTLHLGGSSAEIIQAEEEVHRGNTADSPYLLVSQPTVVDPTRAPKGLHTAWIYAHVPLKYSGDYVDVIEAQVERFAPGFRDCIQDRFVSSPGVLELQNANLVGGDIAGGTMSPRQIIVRPTAAINPYRTPLAGLYLCSSSTPPGGGVHGMCGYHAARIALSDLGQPI